MKKTLILFPIKPFILLTCFHLILNFSSISQSLFIDGKVVKLTTAYISTVKSDISALDVIQIKFAKIDNAKYLIIKEYGNNSLYHSYSGGNIFLFFINDVIIELKPSFSHEENDYTYYFFELSDGDLVSLQSSSLKHIKFKKLDYSDHRIDNNGKRLYDEIVVSKRFGESISDTIISVTRNFYGVKTNPANEIGFEPGEIWSDNFITSVSLIKTESGTYLIPVILNNEVKTNFLFDTGASDLTLTPDILSLLKRNGSLSSADYLGNKTYTLADGKKVNCEIYKLKTVIIGEYTLVDVNASIIEDNNAWPLLGQNVLGRIGKWTINTTTNVLEIHK